MNPLVDTGVKKFSRPTWAEIDLSCLGFNLAQIRRFISPEVKIMPIVKADAYGHGLVEVARYLVDQGIDFLGIACVDEGIKLRESGIGVNLLILGNILSDEAEAVLEYNLIPTICSLETATWLNNLLLQKNHHAKAQVEIDTGMGRIGILYQEALDFFLRLRDLSNLDIEGLWTHFASAEEADFTHLQLTRFNFVLGGLRQLGFNFPFVHTANSIAILKNRDTHFNLIRPGLMLYGVYPDNSLKELAELRPVMQIKTKIVFLKKVPPGQSISYGRTFITQRESLIATLPIGYGDGYSWLLSNRGRVLIKGKSAPIVGRVCMDQTMVDVTDIGEISLGEEAVLIGQQGKERITVEELAVLSDTIPYEILCRISARIPRIYKS